MDDATLRIRIKSMGKELNKLTDDQLDMYIEDASLEVSSLNVKPEQVERLTRYLAAHLATVSIRKVVKEKVDSLERTYASSGESVGLDTTPFGQEFQRILNSLRGRKTLNLTVL
ncbi:DUF4054 domain-containing protein [Fictibacillus sp. JL2B1089]|uniref:DUF4054 domain-containing protein n=1 Tax=Fictibacillus sp. JL2B1089 TaxID=3399565 RepID=UPI003A84324D